MGDILLAPRCCGGGGGTAAQKMKVGLVGGEGGRMGGEEGPKTLPVLGRRKKEEKSRARGRCFGFFLFLSF